jgi:hypothetical protein
MNTDTETCENCGRSIGRLEEVHLWQERTVCAECVRRLRSNTPAPHSGQSSRRLPVLLLSAVAAFGIVIGMGATTLVFRHQAKAQTTAIPTGQQASKDRARIVELEAQVAIMQKQIARTAELEATTQKQVARGPTTSPTTVSATTPAKVASPRVPLTTILADLPESLKPKPGETQRTAQQREDWFKSHLVGQNVSVVVEASNFPVLAIGKWNALGILQDPPSYLPLLPGWYQNVVIRCEFDTAEATQAPPEGSGQGTDGKFYQSDIVTIGGEIKWYSNGFSGIQLLHSQVLRVVLGKPHKEPEKSSFTPMPGSF